MIVEKNGYNELLDLFLDFGQALMRAGAEINRVEDTIERIGKAYGAVKVNVLVIIPSILLTVTFPDGTVITQHRRVHTSVNTDFEKLNKLNALSRKCTESPLPLEELKTAINEIKNQKPAKCGLFISGYFLL